jgi:ribose 5-phosphate isomerase B
MTIYLGADHRGFNLREYLKKKLVGEGYEVVDMGNTSADPNDDYPVFAKAVAEKVAEHPAEDRGIVICGSGTGVDIVANKFKGIRSALATSPVHIGIARHDDDVNVLALPADFLDEVAASAIVEKFLETQFAGDEKYKRRIDEISGLER